ncbi:MAG: hypothetical protein QME85_07060 [Candidatus Saccharicenans sp.]|nr:hypothetical protein [Candidatus Saccharicenans sp.]MDI6848769.1 hypothetical protein [Candidatus Saccharicenans sp.]
MKLGTRIAAAMVAVVISLGLFGLIASGLTVDKIMLGARPIVESVSVFSHILG